MVELTIESIRVSLMNYQRVVILREKASDRYLCIWIGPAEADAIAVQLQEVSVARPLTHDLLRSVIESLGAHVAHVLVNDLANDTFYARVVLDVNGTPMEIDSRPSDAIALAVRVKVPIFAEESVLERAGVMLNPATVAMATAIRNSARLTPKISATVPARSSGKIPAALASTTCAANTRPRISAGARSCSTV